MNFSPNKILSIDWDYVTGDCSDTSYYSPHPHCGFCKDRYVARARGNKEHLDSIWKENELRLLGLRLYKNTPIFVAECHANIIDVASKFDKWPLVYDYDAHFYRYDKSPNLHCGNWVYHLECLGGSVLRRPRSIKKVGAVFICHSSPWTPRCMDEEFFRFIRKISEKTSKPQFIGHRRISLRNNYNMICLDKRFLCGKNNSFQS